MNLSKIRKTVQKVKEYIALMLQEDPVYPWSVIRHCAGIWRCNKLYGSSIEDYFKLHFYEKTHEERKTYFVTNQAMHFINCVNGYENNQRFYDKNYMYHVLRNFTKRDLLFCPPKDYQEFEKFFKQHRKAFYKPANTNCGKGIELWSADQSEITELYERALEQQAVLDEPIIQHPDLARLNPDSINTVKIFTMMINTECHFVAAELLMGRRGSFVDNIDRGGLAACVDIETGIVIDNAYDFRMEPYSVHPDTGVKILGYVLPNWKELLHFTEECARACSLTYVEWDIAIRENDCVLLEANPNARSGVIQIGVFHGRREQFEKLEKLYVQSIT